MKTPLASEVLDRPRGDRREDKYPAELLLYTPEQFGEMFGLSKSTIVALRLSQKWPYCKVGGSILFSRSDVNAILESAAREPEPRRETRTPHAITTAPRATPTSCSHFADIWS
jgi:Helix-turn-helix domain